MEETAINSTATKNLATFQCIVCQRTWASLNDLHRHQSYSHTAEEFSLSTIGLMNEAIRIFPIPNSIVYDNSWLCDPIRQAEVYTYSANALSDDNNNYGTINYALKKGEVTGKESSVIDTEDIDVTKDEEGNKDEPLAVGSLTNNFFNSGTGVNSSGEATILDLSIKVFPEAETSMDTKSNNFAESVEDLCNNFVRLNSEPTKRNCIPLQCPVPRKMRKVVRTRILESLLRSEETERNEEIEKLIKMNEENVDSEGRDLTVNSQDSSSWFQPKETKKKSSTRKGEKPPQKKPLNLKKVVRKPRKKKETASMKKLTDLKEAQLREHLSIENIPAHCEMNVAEDPKKVSSEPVIYGKNQETTKPEDENLEQVQPSRNLNWEESVANFAREAAVVPLENLAMSVESMNPQDRDWNLTQFSCNSRFEEILADIVTKAAENLMEGVCETTSQKITEEPHELQNQNVHCAFFRGNYSPDEILAYVNAAEEGFKEFESTPTEYASSRETEESGNQNLNCVPPSSDVSPEEFLTYFDGEPAVITDMTPGIADERNAFMEIENSGEIEIKPFHAKRISNRNYGTENGIEHSSIFSSDDSLLCFENEETKIKVLPVVKAEKPALQTILDRPKDIADRQIKHDTVKAVNENIGTDAGVDHNLISNTVDSSQSEKKKAKIRVLPAVNAKKPPGSRKKATTSKTVVKTVEQEKAKENLENKKCKVKAVIDHSLIDIVGNFLPESKNEEGKNDVLPTINAKKSASKLKSKNPKTNPVKQKNAKKNLGDQEYKIESGVDHSAIANTASFCSKLKNEEAKIDMVPSTTTLKRNNPRKKAKTAKTVAGKPMKQEKDVYSYTDDEADKEKITSFHDYRAQKPNAYKNKMTNTTVTNNDRMELNLPSISDVYTITESDSKKGQIIDTKKPIKREAPNKKLTKSKTDFEKSLISGRAKQVCNLSTPHCTDGDSVERNCNSVNKENIEVKKNTLSTKISKESKSSTKKENPKVANNLQVIEETAATARMVEDQNFKSINFQLVSDEPLPTLVESIILHTCPSNITDKAVLVYDPENRELLWDSLELDDLGSDSDQLINDMPSLDLQENWNLPVSFVNENVIEIEGNYDTPSTSSGAGVIPTKNKADRPNENPGRRSTRSKKVVNRYIP